MLLGYELVFGTRWFGYELAEGMSWSGYKLVLGASWLGYELAWYDLTRVRVDWKPYVPSNGRSPLPLVLWLI